MRPSADHETTNGACISVLFRKMRTSRPSLVKDGFGIESLIVHVHVHVHAVSYKCTFSAVFGGGLRRAKGGQAMAPMPDRCHSSTRPPDYSSGRTHGPRILRPPDIQS